MLRTVRALAVAFFLVLPVSIFAHPHMFFTTAVEFVWDGAVLTQAYFEWKFDKFFSADIIYGYDVNGDGNFSAAESAEVYNKAFINLKNYYFFTFIRQGRQRTTPATVKDFSVRAADGVVIYRFAIDLPAAAPGQDLFIAVYDYTYFCSISYEKTNPVRLRYDPALVQPRFSITPNRDHPVYYNPLGAVDDTRIYYEWKEGLQVYYPEEIRISYAE